MNLFCLLTLKNKDHSTLTSCIGWPWPQRRCVPSLICQDARICCWLTLGLHHSCMSAAQSLVQYIWNTCSQNLMWIRSPGGLAETDCSISSPELVSVVPGAQKCTFLKMCLGDTDTDGLEFSLWELCLWNWI